jgi:hypothetical protein
MYPLGEMHENYVYNNACNTGYALEVEEGTIPNTPFPLRSEREDE